MRLSPFHRKVVGLGIFIHAMTSLAVRDLLAADAGHDLGHGSEAAQHEAALEHGLAHGGDYHEELDGLPQLDFTTYGSQIFWLFIFFVVLYIIFSKKNLPEISSTIENRREKVEGDLGESQTLKEDAETVQREYEDALQQAREKASTLFREAEENIKSQNAEKLDAFKERSAKQTAEVEAEITAAKEKAMQETQTVAAEIASIAAEKIVGISTDIEQAEKLVKNIGREAA